jgi:hypothetical protein
VTQAKSEEDVFLDPLSAPLTNGNWNLVVYVSWDRDCKQYNSAFVELQTGVGNSYDSLQYTDSSGYTTFSNVTASTTASLKVGGEGMQTQYGVITVFPNTTQKASFQLVEKYGSVSGNTCNNGAIITVAPTGGAVTATVTPVLTDANGNPITTNEGTATYGLGELFAIIPQMAAIVAGLIMIWLCWRTFDVVTDGIGPTLLKQFVRRMF